MTFRDFISPSDHLKWIQGVEANLQYQRIIGITGGIALMILGTSIQIMLMALDKISGSTGNFAGLETKSNYL